MIDKVRLSLLKKFQRSIRYNFKDRYLLNQALTHRSYAYERVEGKISDNERLEFLGDAVLGLAISDYLYGRFPHYQEGEMTRIKSVLVSKNVLEKLSRRIGVGEVLLLGKGEAANGGAEQTTNLAGVYEAIIGAIYLDGGFKRTNKFIESQFKDVIPEIMENGAHKDYKSVLQEYSLKMHKQTPRYAVVFEEGPDHKKYFEVAVSFNGAIHGKGKGKNKKSAQQDAAYNALFKKGLLDKNAADT